MAQLDDNNISDQCATCNSDHNIQIHGHAIELINKLLTEPLLNSFNFIIYVLFDRFIQFGFKSFEIN